MRHQLDYDEDFFSWSNARIKYRNEKIFLTDVCLFSSFSFSGLVEDYVFYYLNELQQAGFSIVFISTSELSEACVKKLSGHCFLIIERENICPRFRFMENRPFYFKLGCQSTFGFVSKR